MIKIILIGISILILLGGVAAIWRAHEVSIYPEGNGQYLDSPNGKYTASAFSMYYEDFWGYYRSYYEFSILPKGKLDVSEAIKVVRMDPLEGPPILPRGDPREIIKWSKESSSATFTFKGVELTLSLYEKNSN